MLRLYFGFHCFLLCYFKFSPLQLNDGVRWYSDNPNIQVFISFTVKITAPSLKKIKYSPYQQVLWSIIRKKHETGMGYRKISYWLNENGYKTPRGHKFKNSHVYSILKKKRIAEEKLVKRYEPKIENLNIKLLFFKDINYN